MSILSVFSLFSARILLSTNPPNIETASTLTFQLDNLDTENFSEGMLRYSKLREAESIDSDHEEIVDWLAKLEQIFSTPEKKTTSSI